MDDYGILSIAPPVLTVFVAIYSRNVILALIVGILFGSLIITDFHPFYAILDSIENQVLSEFANGTQVQVILVILIIGGFVRMLDVSGGARAFARHMTRVVSTPARAQILAWMTGLGIFFTDSGNSLIVGPLYRSVFREFKLCKEKLAYILDTTSSPISILIPFIGWGAYIMSLIDKSYSEIGLTENSFAVLIKVIPYQFYAFLALLSVPIVIFSRKDFGPMLRAQQEYLKNEKVVLATLDEGRGKDEHEPPATEDRLSTFVLPLVVMLGLVIGLISWHAAHDGVTGIHIRSTLIIGYLSASLTCAVMMYRFNAVSFSKSLRTFVEGAESLVYISIVLVLAWSLSSITKDLHTAEYISSLISGSVSPRYFPAIVFLLGAVISLSTGSSYGTFAILMAIAVPVGFELDASMYLTIAGVLSGGLLGDHVSPISDTTVLASVGADCEHISHVATQSVYAGVTGSVTLIAFILAGIYETPLVLFVAIGILLVSFYLVMKYFGSEVHSEVASDNNAVAQQT
jgi:Na+/H+ antiporter NhaC